KRITRHLGAYLLIVATATSTEFIALSACPERSQRDGKAQRKISGRCSNARALAVVNLDKVSYCLNNFFNVTGRHLRINRQRDNPLVDRACDREVLRSVAEHVPVKGMKVQRNEMNRRADSSFSQCFNEIAATDFKMVQGQPNYIKVP